jgi:hypothetical protein
VAVAGTGDNFLLGRVNTAGKQTTLTGAAPNPQLLVQNTSTDGNARGVVGSISSPSAAAGSAGVVGSTASNDPGSAGVIAQNMGAGPGLKVVVNPGAAPFSVNSSTKVVGLNVDQLDGMSSSAFLGVNAKAADSNLLDGKDSTQFLGVNAKAADSNKLDGMDSTQFMQGGGAISAISATTTTPANSSSGTMLGTLNGLTFQGNCANNSPLGTGSQLILGNSTGNTITLLRDGGGAVTPKVLVPNGADGDMPIRVANHFIWHGGLGSKGFTIDTWTYYNNLTCTFDIQKIVGP